MLQFFKKKTETAAFSLAGIGTDMHSHLIPGIDDGAKSVVDALLMIKGLQSLGYEKIITTPHIYKEYYPNTRASILRGYEKLQIALQESNIKMPIEVAAEYFLDEHFESLLEKNEILPLKGIFILVEMSFFGAPPKLFDYIGQIHAKGYIPILAHPERYVFYKDDFAAYEKLKQAGCLFQMNVLSITGYYNEIVKNNALRLLEHNLIDFLGTDLHHQRHLDVLKRLELPLKIHALLQNYPFKNRAIL